MVTTLLPVKVPGNLKNIFLPFDVAPSVKVKATSAPPTAKDKYPVDACSKICNFVSAVYQKQYVVDAFTGCQSQRPYSSTCNCQCYFAFVYTTCLDIFARELFFHANDARISPVICSVFFETTCSCGTCQNIVKQNLAVNLFADFALERAKNN